MEDLVDDLACNAVSDLDLMVADRSVSAAEVYDLYLKGFKDAWVIHYQNLQAILSYGCPPGCEVDTDIADKLQYFLERFYDISLTFADRIDDIQWRHCLLMCHDHAFCFDPAYHASYQDFVGVSHNCGGDDDHDWQCVLIG